MNSIPIPAAASKPERQKRLQQLARQALLFTVPALFLQFLLVRLGGGALWLPGEWRGVLLIVGVLAGQVAFGWAHRSPPRLPEHHAQRSGERAESEEDPLLEHEKRLSALRWAGLCVCFLLGYVFLRTQCVENATISSEVAQSINPGELPFYFDLHEVEPLHEVRASAQAPSAPIAKPLTGTVLVPLFLTDEADRAVQRGRRTEGQNLFQYYLCVAPESLIALVDRNHLAFATTIALFALAFFGIVSTASIAYGRVFSVPEELGAGAVELAHRLLGGH